MTNKGGFLPAEFNVAHDFCFLVHDILAQFVVSGEASEVFTTEIAVEDAENIEAFSSGADIFEWLESTGRLEDRARILKTLVLPAVLSDMLHCIYEALESSRKGKLNITYMLIRKPIQESLFLLESIVLDEVAFGDNLAKSPLTLRPQTVGGVEGAHMKRIHQVLERIVQTATFDAEYLAQLRYAKVEDGFDGICNKAMHLFTEHKAIQTEPLNVNFIFSDSDAKQSQWEYLYSRLPYILVYILRVVEYIGKTICPTHPEYTLDMARRTAAFVALCVKSTLNLTEPLERFHAFHYEWLLNHCADQGFRAPRKRDLERMALTGALPGEDRVAVAARIAEFEAIASANQAY
ncbi:MAG: hypothetical protein ACXW2U_10135 [Telluria sp.]